MIPRRLLLAAPALLLGARALAAAERVPVAATPISRMETSWWRARHEAKLAEIAARPRIDLVWLGDSITQDWEIDLPEDWRNFVPVWQHFYGDRNALNLGYNGDSTAHLLWRMQNGELDGYKPKAAIILIGANNMGRVHWSAPQTIAGIEAVVAEARRRLPTARLVLLSVLPSVRNKYVDRTTDQINRELVLRFGNNAVAGVTYKDVTALFQVNGQTDRTQFLDDQLTPPGPPLHPTAQAQARMAEALEPVLAPILGDRPRRR